MSKKVLTILTIIVVVIGLLFLSEKFGITDFYNRGYDDNKGSDNINYSPPTELEKSAGDEKKQEIAKDESSDTDDPEVAEIVIVDANQYDDMVEVRAFVANELAEGTCYMTFAKSGEQSINKEVPAYPDASTTPCISLTIPRSEFASSGTWELTVRYESTTGITGSTSQEVNLK